MTRRLLNQDAELKARIGRADTQLEVLGVNYPYSRQRVSAFPKVKKERWLRRLKRIRGVTRNLWQRRKLVRSAANPILTWKGGYARPAAYLRTSHRAAAERAILGKIVEEQSFFLAWTASPLLGPAVDPNFGFDLEAVRFQMWRTRRHYDQRPRPRRRNHDDADRRPDDQPPPRRLPPPLVSVPDRPQQRRHLRQHRHRQRRVQHQHQRGRA